jgi:hypothetical protein
MNQINATELEVNGVRYVRADTVSQPSFDGDIRIVVLQRGWIYVGRLERDGNLCRLHNASNIRIWGTTKGLCELVEGPTTSTKLDPCAGIIEFDWLTVIHTIVVNPKKWKL